MFNQDAVLTVVGIGGSGCNAVKYMSGKEALDESIRLIAVNTDNQSLDSIETNITKIQIGSNVTKGRGAGANPEIGRQSAEEDSDIIKSCIEDSDMIFITTGMGGGTGTGASPVVAKIAKELGKLVIAVVTLPFDFEGNKKRKIADQGVANLKEYVDAIVLVPNQKLFEEIDGSMQLNDAFEASNDVLLNGVLGISDIIVKGGLINIDFNDVKAVMTDSGYSMLGVGYSSPDDTDKAKAATLRAIDCPLLEINNLDGANGIIVNISSDGTLTLDELQYIGEIIKGIADEDATIIVGTSVDPLLNGEMKVTIIATNLENDRIEERQSHRFASNQKPRATSSKIAEDFRKSGIKSSGDFNNKDSLEMNGLKRESHTNEVDNNDYNPLDSISMIKNLYKNNEKNKEELNVNPDIRLRAEDRKELSFESAYDRAADEDDDENLYVDVDDKKSSKVGGGESKSFGFLKKLFGN